MSRTRKGSIQKIAQERLGYDDLRPRQEAAIRSLLQGKDTLAVMPTGSGKSAIYQLAAEETPGATIVISPLLALQKDQVNISDSVDCYYQKIGRAGRDGDPAKAVFFYQVGYKMLSTVTAVLQGILRKLV
jgi:superfamily II DNA helicase RecQ